MSRLVAVRPEEVRALLWSFAYFFCLLAGYYVLRPLRDEMGIAGGVRNLHWLFTATFFVMLAAVPIFGAVVARLPRRRFIPLVYHFFVANIAIFWVLLTLDVAASQQVARVFFVWISVFNLFAVSVFWSFMADLFKSDQGSACSDSSRRAVRRRAVRARADRVARGAARPGESADRGGAAARSGRVCARRLETAVPQTGTAGAKPAAAAQTPVGALPLQAGP